MRVRETDLRVVLNEEEKHHIFSEMLDGQVQRVLGVGLEHVIQQWSTQVCEIPRVEIVL